MGNMSVAEDPGPVHQLTTLITYKKSYSTCHLGYRPTSYFNNLLSFVHKMLFLNLFLRFLITRN